LIAIGHAAMIFPPCALSGVQVEINSRDMMVRSNLNASHSREEGFGPIGCPVLDGETSSRMIDATNVVDGFKNVVALVFVGIDSSARRNDGSDLLEDLRFGTDKCPYPALTASGDNNALAFARVIKLATPVHPVGNQIAKRQIATEISAIDFNRSFQWLLSLRCVEYRSKLLEEDVCRTILATKLAA
jgi:hypothetical protein